MSTAVVLRCHASAQIGFGHLMRCRELARHLKVLGHPSVLMGPPLSLQTDGDRDLFADWQPVADRGSSSEDAARVVSLCRSLGAHHLVMDDYRADPEYQLVLRRADLRWLQQFDASAPFDFHADVLVNASPHEQPTHYREYLKNPETILQLGPRYAVLRPAFRQIIPQPPVRPVKRFLLSFGGGDDQGCIALALQVLLDVLDPSIEIVIISGQGNPRNDDLRARIAALAVSRVQLLINPADLPAQVAACDLALIAGGTMGYEVACCGVPAMFIALAPNQHSPCRGWSDLTGAPYLGMLHQLSEQVIRETALSLLHSDAERASIAARGRAMVDGLGTSRLVDALLDRAPTGAEGPYHRAAQIFGRALFSSPYPSSAHARRSDGVSPLQRDN